MKYSMILSDITLMEIDRIYKDIAGSQQEDCCILRSARFSAANTGISPRTINYWVQNGLLTDLREDGQGWHKFSLIDIVFVGIVSKLRSFGLSIKQLQNVKLALFAPMAIHATDLPNDVLTVLEIAFLRAVSFKGDGNTYLMVAADGATFMMTDRDLELNAQAGNLPDTYIYVNLNKLLKDLFPGKNVSVFSCDSRWLDNGEKALLDTIRASTAKRRVLANVDEHGLIDRLETEISGNRSDFESLHNLIDKTRNGNVSIQIRDGKACWVVHKESKKVK